MSNIEREIMIDNLSESAKQTFKNIQSTEKFISKERTIYNKRRNLDQNEYDDEVDEDDDEDEDEDDEQTEDLQNKNVSVNEKVFNLDRVTFLCACC